MAKAVDQFQGLPPKQKATTAAAIAISVVVVLAAERDVQKRPGDAIRGPKLLWRLVCLNALGAVLYFRVGRRPSA